MHEMRRTSEDAIRPVHLHGPNSSAGNRESREGRLRRELERKKRCCANCTYASRPCGRWFRLILSRFSGLLICANSADAPGKLRGVPPSGVCRNFHRRRPPLVRTKPPEPPDGTICYVPLTQGYYAMVDPEDFERVSRYKWCLSRTGNQFYAYRKHRRKSLRMHQFLMDPPKGMVVDHIDGNGLNNHCGGSENPAFWPENRVSASLSQMGIVQ